MSLKILCAGCSPDERAAVEASVRAGIGARPQREPWIVSVVKLGDRWSVTLNGPQDGNGGRSFLVPAADIRRSIAEALGDTSRGPSAGSPGIAVPVALGSGPSREVRDPHLCARCKKPFAVFYQAEPGEGMERAPVACPHCWAIGHVDLATSAALSRDYRVDKAEGDESNG
jgi:hypothetical protein